MAGTGSGYDLSVNTFSPDGRVFQVEYATKSVDSSGTTVAFVCNDGIVFAVEKFLPTKLMVPCELRFIMLTQLACSVHLLSTNTQLLL